MKTTKHIFKTFPEFSTLTYADRDRYEALIADYPPIDNIAFGNLMTWWSALAHCKVSQLNGNLVIAYWFPGDESRSGLSLVGTDKVDESICTILDQLKQQGERARLVHIPEFVVERMRYPDMYEFSSERDSDECIVSVQKLASIKETPQEKRWKIRRFLVGTDEKMIQLKSLDLTDHSNRELLLELYDEWEGKGPLNVAGQVERGFITEAITHSEELGFENVCVYINGKLHSYLLYTLAADPDYALALFGRFSYALPFLFEICVYQYAKWFASQGFKYVNIESDLDLATLRAIKLSLGPVNFLRHYTITPKS